jgi:hypothetical protein
MIWSELGAALSIGRRQLHNFKRSLQQDGYGQAGGFYIWQTVIQARWYASAAGGFLEVPPVTLFDFTHKTGERPQSSIKVP